MWVAPHLEHGDGPVHPKVVEFDVVSTRVKYF